MSQENKLPQRIQVSKPYWVHHDNHAIYSVHIHPDGTRCATGGGDNTVKIWNMEAIETKHKELESGVDKLLSCLSNHTGAVNSVKWSRNGKYLASASDDKSVMIWDLQPIKDAVIAFGSKTVTVENWHCVCALSSHTADVQLVAWSPDAKFLASCSVDNTVIIWDIESKEKQTTLKGHQGWVTGLDWDPLGEFLATQSADGSLQLWNTTTWAVIKRFEHPFESRSFARSRLSNINREIVFTRISFSANGAYIGASQGYDKVFTSPVFERTTWKQVIGYVGHKKPTTVTKFSGVLYKESHSEDSVFTACAVGSMDCAVSVWVTNKTKAVVVLKHFFQQSVLDLSWHPNGLSLLACSHDGTVACFQFAEESLGGVPIEQEQDFSGGDMSVLPEDHDMYAMQLEKKNDELDNEKRASSDDDPPEPEPIVSDRQLMEEQTEVRGKDGRRRIIPVVIPSPSARKSSSLLSRSGSSGTSIGFTPFGSSPAKKGITPAPVQNLFGSQSKLDARFGGSQANVVSTGSGFADSSSSAGNKTSSAANNPANVVNKSNKRKADETFATPARPKPAAKKKAADEQKGYFTPEDAKQLRTCTPTFTRSTPVQITPSPAPLVQQIQVQSATRYCLKLPPLSSNFVSRVTNVKASDITREVHAPEKTYSPTYLEVSVTPRRSRTGESAKMESMISRTRNGVTAWENQILDQVTCVAGNDTFSACGCLNGSLYLFSPSGRMLTPPIFLRAPIVLLRCNQTKNLMSVTQDGSVYVWKISSSNVLGNKKILRCSVEGFLSASTQVEHWKLTPEGIPAVTLSNGYSYAFSREFDEWVRVADNNNWGSGFSSAVSLRSEGVLQSLQKNSSSTPSDLLHLTEHQQGLQSLSYLETQISSSQVLQSQAEFERWARLYIIHLTDNSVPSSYHERRLKEFCYSLLGEISQKSKDLASPTASMDVEKSRELLRSLLPTIGSNQTLRRFSATLREQLAQAERDDDGVLF